MLSSSSSSSSSSLPSASLRIVHLHSSVLGILVATILLISTGCEAFSSPAVPQTTTTSTPTVPLVQELLDQFGNSNDGPAPYRTRSSPEIEKLLCELELLSSSSSLSSASLSTESNGVVTDSETIEPYACCFPSLWQQLNGNWVLRYTNNAERFSTGRLPISSIPRMKNAKTPTVIKAVEQRIDQDGQMIDVYNIIRFAGVGDSDEPSSPYLSLGHRGKVTSNCQPAQLAIDWDRCTLHTPRGKDITVPLLGPSFLRRGFFDTTYIDDKIRISRGPFGEVRVFERKQS